jgi:hypothetical protein
MGFPPLLNANTTVDPWINKAFTMFADHASILFWQSQFGSHSDFSCYLGVTLCQLWFFSDVLLSQTKKGVNALYGYLSGFIHFVGCHRVNPFV